MSKIYVDEIRPKTSGNQVLFPEKPAFIARYQNSTGSLNLSSPTTLVYDLAVLNRGNCYNTSTGVFTAPVDGLYQINYGARYNGATGSYAYTQLLVNSSSNFYAQNLTDNEGNTYHTFRSSSLLLLSAGDTVEVEGYVDGDTAVVVTDYGSEFSGYLVG